MRHHPEVDQRVAFARQQRGGMSRIEEVLWRELRGRRLDGHKFRRQHPIGPYVADFLYDDAKVVIEADGPVHQEDAQRSKDRVRDEWMRERGYRVLRFSEELIATRLGDVLDDIRRACGGGSP